MAFRITLLKHARHLVAINERAETRLARDLDLLALFGEDGEELVGNLLEHEAQINVAAREHDIVKVEARDVEELLNERVKAMRLLECDAREASALLCGKIRASSQQGEIADDARKRRP